MRVAEGLSIRYLVPPEVEMYILRTWPLPGLKKDSCKSKLNVIQEIVGFLDERKAEDIVALDLRQHANIADYFIIATGANKPHLKALYDGLQRLFKDAGFKGYHGPAFPTAAG